MPDGYANSVRKTHDSRVARHRRDMGASTRRALKATPKKACRARGQEKQAGPTGSRSFFPAPETRQARTRQAQTGTIGCHGAGYGAR